MSVIREAPRRELYLVGGAMAATLALVVVYVLTTRDHALVGDEREYHIQGTFFTEGKLWWSTTPFGIAHASAWKAPLYPAWVGFWYEVLGTSPLRVELVQAFLAPITVALTWLLARRLFSARVAVASAWVVALFPLAWEFYGVLFSEALAIPLTMLVLYLVLDRDVTTRRATLVGAVMGLSLLARPSSVFIFAAIAAAWIVAGGLRRGALMTALTVGVAVLVVLPWTIRNYVVADGFVPISAQDGAPYGTFNDTSANDPDLPYAWRPEPRGVEVLDPNRPISDAEVRSRGLELAREYVKDHPASVPKAFYWNGLTRFWDVRRPSHSLDEAQFQTRSRTVRGIGLGFYYVLLPLALVGLWRLRDRKPIVIPVLAMAVAASVVFTVAANTRYRAPLEPMIAVLACSILAPRRQPEASVPEPVSA